MRTQRIGLALVLSMAATQVARAEEYRGTWEQQMACTPDVWRLCSDQVPDVTRIVACLRQNTPNLSGGCRAVFESSANAQQPDAPRAAPRTRAAPSQRQQPMQPQPLPRPYVDDDE